MARGQATKETTEEASAVEEMVDDLLTQAGDPEEAETEAGPAAPLPDPNDFLFGRGTPWVILKAKGQEVDGELVEFFTAHQRDFDTKKPLYWTGVKGEKPSVDGLRDQPVHELVLVLQCTPGFDDDRRDEPVEDDDGKRELHVSGTRAAALAEAMKAAGVRQLAIGARVTMKHTAPHKVGVKSASYEATYTPPK